MTKQQISQNVCQRIPFWMDAKSEPFLCWLHLPNNNQISQTGVVVCNPLGYEYSHTHRTIRHLCDNLAADGQPTIRFDYHGTGDSFSNLLAPKRIATFLQNIDQVISKLKEVTGISSICLIGLRLGATLAAEYAKTHSVDKLVLWSPCVKGRAYVREMKALEKLASHATQHKHEFIDSGGFMVSDETAAELCQINLLKQNYLVNQKVLLIERNDLKTNDKLASTLISAGLASVEQYFMSGYMQMMAEPQLAQVPFESIQKIITWLKPDNIQTNNLLALSTADKQVFADQTQLVNHFYNEDIYYQDTTLGILTKPKEFTQNHNTKPLIILANSGSVHRVGPNRVYVELARCLAESGFTSLRFDLRQLGDSVIGRPYNENNPYSHEAISDIENIINAMKKIYGFKRFIISGLCSGAHNVFHAGLTLTQQALIDEVILINPLTFYKDIDSTNKLIENNAEEKSIANFQVETDAKQYRASIMNPKKWAKLFSGRVNINYLVRFLLQKTAKTLTTKIASVAETLGLYQGDQLSLDLKKYKKNNINISFFIASKDPGKEILMSQSKKTVHSMITSDNLTIYDVPDADHTFSSFQCRQDFVYLYVEHIKRKYQ